jgi:hypothetical protein
MGPSLIGARPYWAAFSNLVSMLPPDQCPVPAPMRANVANHPPEVAAALDPALIAHRDFVFAKHVGLPLEL